MHRVCCFCETWESGGIESVLNNFLCHMDLSDMEVDIVAVCLRDSVFTAGLKARGVRFVELSGKLHSAQNYRRFRQLLKERRYDTVHFNLFHGLGLYYVEIAQQEGVPVRIAHSHNTALRKSRGRAAKMLVHKAASRKFTKSATDLWACSRAAAEFLFCSEDLKRMGYRFVPNGIELERFRFDARGRSEAREELGVGDAFLLGNVGRLCYQKNQDFLLDVFAAVVKRRPDSRLLLIGSGEDELLLKEKAERLKIAEKVIFYGVTKHVERLLWAMDAFILTSRFEGLPVTAVEAQSAGLPCLFSGSITDEVRLGEHVEFRSLTASAEAWADAVFALSGYEDRTAGMAAVENTGFSAAGVARAVEAVYVRGR